MRCPFCREDNDRVVDSRSSEDRFAIRRRRECLECKRRFTTYERLDEMNVKVIKKDSVREAFEREKIRRGLAKACWKRPVSDEQIDTVVASIEGDVYANFETEVTSEYLGERAMEHLSRVDQVAYVRFASVYREFTDVEDFVAELKSMLSKSTKAKR